MICHVYSPAGEIRARAGATSKAAGATKVGATSKAAGATRATGETSRDTETGVDR